VVEWSLSEEVPSVFLDVQQLELAIINLGSNARDAMPEGGRLTVRTSREDLRDAAARSVGVPPGVYACLSVSDTGIGMDSRVRERLFEPFFTTKDPAHGTGLGLSMVHGFVEQSGGGIAVQSAAGRGSTFSLFFPAAGNAPVVTKPDSSQSGTSVRGGTETLLVVEDEQAVLDLMEEALLSFGYTVLTAPTPAQAIAVVAGLKQPPDLLVTDVLMPGMRGPELAARLRQMHPGLPVLYVSGHVLDSFDRGELEAIRSNFLEKPFTPRTLGRSVRRLLDARHPKV
jgi:CheY-like chemotaxis protein